MNDINILHLLHRRKNFAELSYFLLSKCKFKNFDITICGIKDVDEKEVYELYDKVKHFGLNIKFLIVDEEAHNYTVKLKTAVKLNYKYTIKMDEDIFLGPNAWDYFFNNVSILDNDENILLTPALSTGIPTADDFIKNNFNEEEQEEIKSLFNKTNVPSNL